MTGTVCLQGGAEFSVGCRQMDAELARLADGPVVVSALAGTPGADYRTATANGVRHFSALTEAPVVAAPDAREQPKAALEALRSARLLVLPGGSPTRLLQALTATGVEQVLLDLLADGGVVMGSSAGAMVLCAWTVLPDSGRRVVAGLGAVPGALVLPHYSGGQADWLRAVDAAVPDSTVVLGLPEESGVLLADGRITAVGRSASTLVRSGTSLGPGQELAWPPA